MYFSIRQDWCVPIEKTSELLIITMAIDQYKAIFKESELLVNPQGDVAFEMQNALSYLSILRSNLKTTYPDSSKVSSEEDGEYLVRKEAQRLMTAHEVVPAETNRFKALCFLYTTYRAFIGLPGDTFVQSAEQGDLEALNAILTTLLQNYDEVRRVARKHTQSLT